MKPEDKKLLRESSQSLINTLDSWYEAAKEDYDTPLTGPKGLAVPYTSGEETGTLRLVSHKQVNGLRLSIVKSVERDSGVERRRWFTPTLMFLGSIQLDLPAENLTALAYIHSELSHQLHNLKELT